ncbi:hypothetical protein FQA39_LY02463 [Lamprigera yunnana]|nr:hypothetical protein FQA39_LY02463 [Lamprigera yunnana]
MNNSYDIDHEKDTKQSSWWKRRSKLEKKLTISSILALLLIIILVIVIIIFFTRTPETCLSSECIRVTNELLDHIDTEVDPCEDFYEFSCGTFMDNVQLEDQQKKSVATFMHDTVLNRIEGIVEEPVEEDDPRSIVMAKQLYRSCNNLSAIEEKGLRLIKDSLRQMGGWPLLEGNMWREKDFDWKIATYKLRELGYDFDFFIYMFITEDEREPSKRIIKFYGPWNSIQNLDEEEELYSLYVNISIIFGADRAKARSEFREVIDFIKTISKDPTEESNTNDKYDPLTISELQYKFRDIPWLEYINRLQFPAPNISYEQIVTVADTPYFIRLQNALRRTTKRTIANFIAISTIVNQGFYLTEEVRDAVTKFYKRLHNDGIDPLPPRHKLCTYVTMRTFSLSLQAAYIEKYFTVNAKNQATDILYNIRNQFKEVINNFKWMDDATRIKALERLSSSKNYIGYPNDLLNFDKIDQRYIGYQMEEDNFLASMLNANYYKTNYQFKLLHEPVEKDEELNTEYATGTSHYYQAGENLLTFPAGYLQDVIFDENRPQYLNYGALGSSMGHQVFHTVFEGKSCRQSSKDYDWHSTQSLLTFNEKLSCVAMHFGKYFVPEIKEYLNSSNTKAEDIADIAGVKLAYESYNNWINKNGPEQKLPGLDYTPKQLFWIASAIRYCSKSTPLAMEKSVAHDYNTLKKYAVLGNLRNLDEFSNDFHCSRDSFMNNDNKCELW